MKNLVPYILAAIFLVLFLRQCERSEDLKDRSDTTVAYLTDSIKYYKNKNGQEIAIRSALLGEKKELELLLQNTSKQLADLTKEYKRIKAAGEIGQVVRIDTVHIHYTDTVPFVFERKVKLEDPFFTLLAKTSHKGLTIESLTIPNALSFAVGEKKGKFTIEAVNSNPLIKTTSLDAYTLEIPRRRFGLSIFAGYGMGADGLTPLVGVGIAYDIFQF